MTTPPEPDHDGDLRIVVDANTLRVHGDVDAHTAPTLADALSATSGDVVLDIAGVDFVDSTGLRVLVEAHQLLDGRGNRLSIVDPTPAVQRMFELSVVDTYLDIRRS